MQRVKPWLRKTFLTFHFHLQTNMHLDDTFHLRLDCKIITVRQVGCCFLCILQYYCLIIISSYGKYSKQNYQQMERENKLKEKRHYKNREFKVQHGTRQKIQGYIRCIQESSAYSKTSRHRCPSYFQDR